MFEIRPLCPVPADKPGLYLPFRPAQRTLRFKSIRVSFLQFGNIRLKNVIQRQIQRRGSFRQIPRDIAKLLRKVPPVQLMALRHPFFTMSMASPDSPHKPMTLLINMSLFVSSGFNVVMANF